MASVAVKDVDNDDAEDDATPWARWISEVANIQCRYMGYIAFSYTPSTQDKDCS